MQQQYDYVSIFYVNNLCLCFLECTFPEENVSGACSGKTFLILLISCLKDESNEGVGVTESC